MHACLSIVGLSVHCRTSLPVTEASIRALAGCTNLVDLDLSMLAKPQQQSVYLALTTLRKLEAFVCFDSPIEMETILQLVPHWNLRKVLDFRKVRYHF
jgi:hypothetical protein